MSGIREEFENEVEHWSYMMAGNMMRNWDINESSEERAKRMRLAKFFEFNCDHYLPKVF